MAKNKKQYVSREDAMRRRDENSAIVMKLLEIYPSVDRAMLIAGGMDVSVAGRTLTEMTTSGVLTCKKSNQGNSYKLKPEGAIGAWVKPHNRYRLGMYWPHLVCPC